MKYGKFNLIYLKFNFIEFMKLLVLFGLLRGQRNSALNEISLSYFFRLKPLRSSSKMDYLAIYEDVEQLASIEYDESSRKG